MMMCSTSTTLKPRRLQETFKRQKRSSCSSTLRRSKMTMSTSAGWQDAVSISLSSFLPYTYVPRLLCRCSLTAAQEPMNEATPYSLSHALLPLTPSLMPSSLMPSSLSPPSSLLVIMNRKPQQAWELYLRLETSADSFSLLQLIANDCYKVSGWN